MSGWLHGLATGLVAVSALIALVVWIRWRRDRRAWSLERSRLEQVAHERQTELTRMATSAERERIFRDLHDDLGARLLDLVYVAPTPELADQSRGVLQQLRVIVADAHRPPSQLLELLDELRMETERRLTSAARILSWEQQADIVDVQLDQAATLHLARIVREAVTNALRHSGLTRLRVKFYVVASHLMCDVTDDGSFDADRIGAGSGTRSMQERADLLGARIAWHPGTWGGTKVTLRVPLP